MSNPRLFEPISLRSLTLPNRIVVAPMCQYEAIDGDATAWHHVHLGSLACGTPGLLLLEATAVEARGRITPNCLGLWSDSNEQALAKVLETLRAIASCNLSAASSMRGMGSVAAFAASLRAADVSRLPRPPPRACPTR